MAPVSIGRTQERNKRERTHAGTGVIETVAARRIDSAGLECEKVANAIIACGDGGGRKIERAWENNT